MKYTHYDLPVEFTFLPQGANQRLVAVHVPTARSCKPCVSSACVRLFSWSVVSLGAVHWPEMAPLSAHISSRGQNSLPQNLKRVASRFVFESSKLTIVRTTYDEYKRCDIYCHEEAQAYMGNCITRVSAMQINANHHTSAKVS